MSESEHSSDRAGWLLDHTYAALPAVLHAEAAPTPVRAPRLMLLNSALARDLGLDPALLAGSDAAEIFVGNRPPPGARFLAQAYAGHQYGHFTPLGDGRALLLGEQIASDGARYDVQLKGAGPTAYSRRGDGRAALGPMLREYILGEAMHALGIPTTRALAVAATGEEVWRQPGSQPGAVLTRIAASHLRVGTFEWAAAVATQAGDEPLRALCAYAIRRHYPELAGAEHPARALLAAVVERQAQLVARWLSVGFVHGVMNTDNMAISGETIDYGPCAFIDAYDPQAVFSSIDAHGRYAFGNQPRIAQWNLARFAEALLPLLDPSSEERALELANAAVRDFAPRFAAHSLDLMRLKLGLGDARAEDTALVEDLLAWMRRARADFTNTFAALATADTAPPAALADPEFKAWHSRWLARLAGQTLSAESSARMRRANCPAVIPRNHVVEAALNAASAGDLAPIKRLLEVLSKPHDHAGAPEEFRTPAPASSEPYRTFCGT